MRITNLIIFGLIGILTQKTAAMQSLNHEAKSKVANQWEVVDIHFKTKNLPAKPEDTSFLAELSRVGSSDTITVSGFYNGDKSYLVHFCPESAGVWNYRTKSDVKDLNGLKGQIKVDRPLVGRKGSIKLNPKSTREFIYSNGDPYFPICFEVDWLFALDAENPDDIPVTRKFVNTIAENGYNQLIMNVFAYDVGWKKDSTLKDEHNYGSPKVFPFAGNNTTPDHTKLDSPDICLERAYQCVFAGTYPTHYWQGSSWYAVIQDIDALAPEERPKLEYYKHMADLVSKYDLGGLKAGDEKGNGGFSLHSEPNTQKISSKHTKFFNLDNKGFWILIVGIDS